MGENDESKEEDKNDLTKIFGEEFGDIMTNLSKKSLPQLLKYLGDYASLYVGLTQSRSFLHKNGMDDFDDSLDMALLNVGQYYILTIGAALGKADINLDRVELGNRSISLEPSFIVKAREYTQKRKGKDA